jgi:hypothetical protein
MTLFEHLDNITIHKKSLDVTNNEDMKSYSSFLINRFVSMTDIFLPIVNEINKFGDVPKEIHQQFFLAVLPKRKQFFQYIKKSKDVNSEDKEILSNHFEIGTRDTEEMINTLEAKQIQDIVDKYKQTGRVSKV